MPRRLATPPDDEDGRCSTRGRRWRSCGSDAFRVSETESTAHGRNVAILPVLAQFDPLDSLRQTSVSQDMTSLLLLGWKAHGSGSNVTRHAAGEIRAVAARNTLAVPLP